ncbi:MAG: asparagine--tRNA ligase [Candidatus Makana argininalis]
MKNVYIVDLIKGVIPINKKINVKGWVRNRRDSKLGISFINLYDGSCFSSIQIIVKKKIINYKNIVLKLTSGCSISVKGTFVKSLGMHQKYEIIADSIDLIGWVKNAYNYPISSKRHSLEYLREVLHLRPRTNLIGAVTRIRHSAAKAIHKFMDINGFFWLASPLITSYNTELSCKRFRVSTLNLNNIIINKKKKKIDYINDFFSKESFLTVSGQLNCESYACCLSKMYTFGPVFRAENSNTNRHLAEFWMIEPEVAFYTLNDIILLSINMIKYIINSIINERKEDIIFLKTKIDNKISIRLKKILQLDFLQIKYNEIIKILEKNNYNFKNKIFYGKDLSFEHEKYLTEIYFKSPIIIIDYPKYIKAFYMRINKDNKTVAAMDFLVPKIGEIIGGSQREERLKKLDIRFKEMNINKKEYDWYRDLRIYGTVPHSGFGLGFERLIMYITGLKNIRDVMPFPRVPKNSNF